MSSEVFNASSVHFSPNSFLKSTGKIEALDISPCVASSYTTPFTFVVALLANNFLWHESQVIINAPAAIFNFLRQLELYPIKHSWVTNSSTKFHHNNIERIYLWYLCKKLR